MLNGKPSIYVGLTPETLPRSIQYLRDKEEVVIESPAIGLTLEYPLSHPATVHLTSAGGFTREQLCTQIANAHQHVYREEARTTSSSAERFGNLCVNRAQTSGTFGIWGQSLDDLLLHTVYYDAENIRLGIDS